MNDILYNFIILFFYEYFDKEKEENHLRAKGYFHLYDLNAFGNNDNKSFCKINIDCFGQASKASIFI